MYNAHRGMVPTPTSRLTELLDQVRQEFENQQNRTQEYDQQSEFVCSSCVCLLMRDLLRTESLFRRYKHSLDMYFGHFVFRKAEFLIQRLPILDSTWVFRSIAR